MTGSSTRVSGTANAGTAFTIRKRFLILLDTSDSVAVNVMMLCVEAACDEGPPGALEDSKQGGTPPKKVGPDASV